MILIIMILFIINTLLLCSLIVLSLRKDKNKYVYNQSTDVVSLMLKRWLVDKINNNERVSASDVLIQIQQIKKEEIREITMSKGERS